jgi:hypothetical protein
MITKLPKMFSLYNLELYHRSLLAFVGEIH